MRTLIAAGKSVRAVQYKRRTIRVYRAHITPAYTAYSAYSGKHMVTDMVSAEQAVIWIKHFIDRETK